MESRVSTSLNRSTRETWSLCERASVRTMKSKSAAVNRARQFALIIGTLSCAISALMASQRFFNHRRRGERSRIHQHGLDGSIRPPLEWNKERRNLFNCLACSGVHCRWRTCRGLYASPAGWIPGRLSKPAPSFLRSSFPDLAPDQHGFSRIFRRSQTAATAVHALPRNASKRRNASRSISSAFRFVILLGASVVPGKTR
jgi:hypothetical protein